MGGIRLRVKNEGSCVFGICQLNIGDVMDMLYYGYVRLCISGIYFLLGTYIFFISALDLLLWLISSVAIVLCSYEVGVITMSGLRVEREGGLFCYFPTIFILIISQTNFPHPIYPPKTAYK